MKINYQVRPGDPLTAREREVLTALCTGQTPARIAQTFFISIRTVNYHVQGIYKKLGCNHLIGAYNVALEQGLVVAPARKEEGTACGNEQD